MGMKIIADTNIWYYLGQKVIRYESIMNQPIRPTFVNIFELSKSHNLLDKEDLSRSAIQMLFKFRKKVIYEPPFIYLAKLHQDYIFNPQSEIRNWLTFTEKIASGYSFDESKKEAIKMKLDSISAGLSSGADLFNAECEKSRLLIKNKKAHKQIDSHQITGRFINVCVETLTGGKCNLYEFDLNRIELLVRTLDHFFKTIETSRMKIQPNDWYDFAILAYVQPGDKYWTREKRWIELITQAGCEDYLYNEKSELLGK